MIFWLFYTICANIKIKLNLLIKKKFLEKFFLKKLKIKNLLFDNIFVILIIYISISMV